MEIKYIENVSFTPTAKIGNSGTVDTHAPPENCFTVEMKNRGPLVVVATERRIAQSWVRGLNLLVAEKGESVFQWSDTTIINTKKRSDSTISTKNQRERMGFSRRLPS